MEHDRVMTIKDVAEFFNVSTQIVYNLVNHGEIEAYKVGSSVRIMYSDLQIYIEKQKQNFSKSLTLHPASHLIVKDLNLSIGNFEMRNICFELQSGKTLGIVGRSGSGKTLFLRALAGLESVNKGDIQLCGQSIHDLTPQQRKIGYVSEENTLIPHLDARSNIAFPNPSASINKQKAMAQMREHIKKFDLDPKILDLLPKALSDDQKKMVSLARATNKPYELLLMDEVLTNLDQRSRASLKNALGDLGKTTILSFHYSEDAFNMVDMLGVFHQGELIQFGDKWEVFEHPVNEEAMWLLSKYELNLMPVTIQHGKISQLDLDVPDDLADQLSNHLNKKFTLAFRSEEIEITPTGIPVSVGKQLLRDSNKKLSLCKFGTNQELTLLLPLGVQGDIHIRPKKPFFFPVEHDRSH